jgi:hypothetical protein
MTTFCTLGTTEPARGSQNRNSRDGSEMEQPCFVVFVLMAVAIPIAIAIAIAASHKRRIAESYSLLAKRYGGTLDGGGVFFPGTVRFSHAGSSVIVDVYSTGAQYYTQVHFRGLQWPIRCEVYPDGIWSRVGNLIGMEDVEIGSPAFDRKYIIKGDDIPAMRNLLSPGVQQQIEHLRRFLGNDDIYVWFSRHELLVKKLSFIRDHAALHQFTEMAIELYDQAVLSAERGIEFVRDATPAEITEAVCQICGETVGNDVVFCRACRTPHHKDCWEYYGACSTYGCREKSYLRPESKRAKRARESWQ